MPRRVVFSETGGPEVLRLEEFASPGPGEGEVRLRIRAIGLNRAELMFRAGEYLKAPTFPSQLGYEAAGEIEAIGPGVVGFGIGDRVSVIPAFDVDSYSLYGEVSLAPARALVRIPDGVSWESAAAAWMQFGTAWGPLIQMARIGQGDVVLLPAASSSIGLAAIQIANLAGATPIALTRHSDKARALLGAGASAVIATEEQDLVAEVMKLTAGRGAQLVFDPVGGPTFPKLINATAVGGLVIVYGALSPEITPLPMLDVLVRDITIRSYALAAMMADDSQIAQMKAFVSAGLASGGLSPLIAKKFRLDQIVEAHSFLEANGHLGKVIVTT